MKDKFLDTLADIYSVSCQEIESLVPYMELTSFSKGEYIISEGQRCSNLYFIKSGVIRSFRECDGEETTLWFASQGEVVIQVWGYCKGSASQENFECETDCELYVIPKFQIDILCGQSLNFANLFRRIFESHSMIMEEFLIFFADNKSAQERYLAMIKRNPNIFNQVSLKKLASFIYITPQSLSRIRAGLRRKL